MRTNTGTASAEPVAKETQMQTSMRRLLAASAQAAEAMAHIKSRLDPVLLPDMPDQCGDECEKVETRAPLCEELRAVEIQLQATTNSAANILHRLAI